MNSIFRSPEQLDDLAELRNCAPERTYLVEDEGRFDGLTEAQTSALVAAEAAGRPMAMIRMTWDELAAVNEPETMEEISELQVGEETILGMCCPIKRLS